MTRLQLPCVPRPGPIAWSMLATCLLISATSASASAANQPAAPTIESETVSNIEPDTSGATLEAQIATNGLQTEYQLWIRCGYAIDCGSPQLVAGGTIPAGTPSQDVSANVDGLTHGDDYTYWAFATNLDGTTTGETRDVQHETAWPGLASETGAASSITDNEATLAGQVLPAGAETWEYTYFFEYGPTTSYGASEPNQPGVPMSIAWCGYMCDGEGKRPIPVSATLTGLTPATTYHYRFVTTSAHGYRQFGPDATFTTSAPPPIEPPSIETTEAPTTGGGGSGQTDTSSPLIITPLFTPTSTPASAPPSALAAPAPPLTHTAPRSKAAKQLPHTLSMCHHRRTHKLACRKRAYRRYGRAAGPGSPKLNKRGRKR